MNTNTTRELSFTRHSAGPTAWTLIFAITLLARGAFAANWAWDTAPASANFSGANWTSGTTPGSGTGTPASGDGLYFGTSSQLSPNNDLSGYTFAGITFNAGASAFTIGGNTFVLNGTVANSSSSAQTINNNITLNNNESVNATSAALTLGGVISDGGNNYGLTAGGGSSQTLTLSGVNTYGGGTTITSGKLSINSAGALGSGNITMANGSSSPTLQVSAGLTLSSGLTITVGNSGHATVVASFVNPTASTTFEIDSKVTGSSGNVKSGSNTGTVRFANDTSDYATFQMGFGTTEFTSVANAGAVSALGAGSGGGLGNTTYVIGNGSSTATFRYVGSGNSSTTRQIDWQGTSGGLTLDASGGGTVQFLSTGNLKSGSGSATVTLTGSNTGNNILAQVVNNSGGTTTLTKSGAGTWSLTGANTHSGGTTLSSGGGVLNLGNAAALGTGTFTISGNSSFDNTTGGNVTVNNAFTLSGGSPTYVGSANNMTINGAVTLSGANRTITVNANTLILGGQITGAFTLTVAGAGTLVLNNPGTADTHSGTIVSAGTLDLGGTTQTLGAVTFSGASTTQNGTINGTSYAGTLGSGLATVSAVLAGGSSTLNHSGSGTLFLAGANTYGGGSTISGAGTLLLTNDTALGSASAGLTFSASGILAATNNAAPANNPVTINSSRIITVNSTFTASVFTPDTNNLTIAAKITGAGSITKKSSSYMLGTVRFSNDNSDYTGTFTAGYGNTEFTSVANGGSPSALGAGSTAYAIANSSSSATFRYVGTANTSTTRALNWSATTGGLALDSSGSGTVQFLASASLRTGSGNDTLTLQGSNVGANTLAQPINDGAASGTTTVTKAGAGTWVLTGANTYSGATTISGGTLALSGSGALASPSLSLAAGATLDVSGVGGGYALSGGQTLYATNGATATINGSLNLGSASLVMTNTPNTPTLAVTGGTLTLAGGSVITVNLNNGGNRLTAGSYKLISKGSGGAVAATLPGSVTVGGDGIAVGATAQLRIVAGELYLNVCVAPAATVRSVDSTNVCSGSPATIHADLTGVGPWNVTWSDGTVQSGVAASPATLTASPSATTTYTVTALSDSCYGAGTASGSATVTVTPPPTTANAGPNQNLCGTASTTLAANTPTVGQGAWSVVGGTGTFSDVTDPAATVSGLSYGTNVLQWSITNGVCPSSTSEVTITRNGVVAITWSFTNLDLSADTNCSALMPDVTGTNYIQASDGTTNALTIIQTPTNNAVLALGTNEVVLAVSSGSCPAVYSTNSIVVVVGTSLALGSSANPALPGTSVTFTATVTPALPCAPAPAGTVTFKDDGSVLGTAGLDGLGTATFSVSTLTHGSHAISAEYAGQGASLGSTNSLSPDQVINTPPVAQDIFMGALSWQPATITIIGGKYDPTDADGDPVTVTGVESPLTTGVASTDGTSITYTPTNAAPVTNSFTYTVSDDWGGSDTKTITVWVSVQGEGFNRIGSPVLTNGLLRLTYTGIPTYPYALDTTSNLDATPVPWTPVVTNTADSHGSLVFEISPAGASAYFRTRSP